MLNRKKILPFISLVLCLGLSGLFSTNTYGRDSNGVTVTDFLTSMAYGMHIDHFTSFDPSATFYVFNEAGGSGSTDGEVVITGNTGAKSVHIAVSILGSTSLDFQLQGKIATAISTWAPLFTFTTTVTVDEIIPISEYITSYRLGVKVNTDGTDTVDCSTTIITHR
ncbi:MAG TPA: hypothetical protein ENH85_11195 [Candidatus Scalindua sp.]|nr:hypothetical protein [Candidatus Scalindua sp.]